MTEILTQVRAGDVPRVIEDLSHRPGHRRWRRRIIGIEHEGEVVARRFVAVDVAVHDRGERSAVHADVAAAEEYAPRDRYRAGDDDLMPKVGVRRSPRATQVPRIALDRREGRRRAREATSEGGVIERLVVCVR